MLEIRLAYEDDIQAIQSLLVDSYRYVSKVEGYNSAQLAFLIKERAALDLLRGDIERHECLVAVVGGKIVGMLSCNKNEVAKLYVQENSHKRGIGSRLLKEAISMLRKRGYNQLVLGASFTNVPFYEKNGFHIIHKKECSGVMAPNNVVVMGLDFDSKE